MAFPAIPVAALRRSQAALPMVGERIVLTNQRTHWVTCLASPGSPPYYERGKEYLGFAVAANTGSRQNYRLYTRDECYVYKANV